MKASEMMDELNSLLSFLSTNGRCINEIGKCQYVDEHGLHAGCAVGRHLTEEEKKVWGEHERENYGAVDYATARSLLGAPQFFKDWPRHMVSQLQAVHDAYGRPHFREEVDDFKEMARKYE